MVKEYKVLAFSIVLFIISSIAINYGALDAYLMFRLISTVCFGFVFVFFKGYKHKIMTIVMLLMVFFDVFSLYIEFASYSKIAMLSRAVLYSLLILLVFKKLRFNNATLVESIVYGCIGLLNFSLLYMLINMVEAGVLDQLHKTIVIGSCILMLLACIAAANYNTNKLHGKSVLFMIFTYSMAFSDIIAFSGFYLEYPALFYYERIPAIAAGYCLVFYTLDSFKPEKESITS